MFAVNLDVHVARCEQPKCERYLSLVDADLCGECPHRLSVADSDELADSLMDDVFGIEPDGRAGETINQLFETHCKECQSYDATDRMCKKLLCDNAIQIKTLMKNPSISCPMEKWR
jgi:predicted metal-binding protein